MKKVLLIMGLAISTLSFGQKKSDKFVSGTVSYTKAKDVKGTFTVAPTVGYYITDKFSVGVFGELGESATEKTTNLGIFGRCDFMKIGKSTTVYSQLGISSNSEEVSSVKTTSTSVGLDLGVNYTITPKLDLTLNIAQLASYVSTSGSNVFTIGFQGLDNPIASPSLGILYRF